MAGEWSFQEWRSFPPLYTLQPVETTQAQQLKIWVDLVHAWAAEQSQWRFILAECPVFENREIGRRLGKDGIAAVGKALLRDGRAEAVGDEILLFEVRPEDLAQRIYDWVLGSGMVNGVYTVFELHDANGLPESPARNVEPILVRRALAVLERNSKAEVFQGDTTDDLGVKFLSNDDGR